VRMLAQRSANAAKEVRALIDVSVSQVSAGEKMVQTAGQTMKEVVVSIRRVASIVSDIASSTSVQSASIGQVSQAVDQLDRMTQQNSTLVEENAVAAENLRDQAARLTQSIAVFQTEEHPT